MSAAGAPALLRACGALASNTWGACSSRQGPWAPRGAGGDDHSAAFITVTSKRAASRSVSRPLLFSCHPEPLQGRLCARAISGDPFLPQATHPGVIVGMTEEQSGNCLQCTGQGGRHSVGQPHSPTPKYCCVVPGDRDFRTKSRSLPVPRPGLRGECRLRQLLASETRSPRPARGRGGSRWAQVRTYLSGEQALDPEVRPRSRPLQGLGRATRGPGRGSSRWLSERLTWPAVSHPQEGVTAGRADPWEGGEEGTCWAGQGTP